jgi:NitT/TauT family transport system permease protein
MPTNFQVGLRMTKLLPMALVKNLTIIIQPLISIAGLFLLWELAVYALSIPGYILPAPSAIWRGLAELGMTSLLGHIGATLTTVLLGFSLSVLVSLPLAIAITASPAISRVIYPLLILTQSIPKVALAPILIIMLGTNALPRVLVSFLVAFFPLVVSTAAGLLAAPPELIELGRSYRASKLKELIRIRLPFAIPFIFSGLKVASALSVVGAVVAEFVAANQGLGYLITTSMAFFQTPAAWGAVIILAFMGMGFFGLIALIEKVFFPWANPNPMAGE